MEKSSSKEKPDPVERVFFQQLPVSSSNSKNGKSGENIPSLRFKAYLVDTIESALLAPLGFRKWAMLCCDEGVAGEKLRQDMTAILNVRQLEPLDRLS